MNQKWYLSTWIIAACFTFSILIIPFIVGVILLIKQTQENKKNKVQWENSGFGDAISLREQKENLAHDIEKQEADIHKQLQKKLSIQEEITAIEKQKEEQRRIKEQMREEERVKREIEKEKQKIEKEEKHFKQEIQNLQMRFLSVQQDERDALEEKIKELEEKLVLVEKDKEHVYNREQNTRAGYVYIISNIGSFGEDVYKIGMTRRLEPMDRIKELGDASVPFTFDVHAMIFSEDAPTLEKTLHDTFQQKSVNKVNYRKEFFNVSLSEIEEVVKRNHNKTVEFTKMAEAKEYRETLQQNKLLEKAVVTSA